MTITVTFATVPNSLAALSDANVTIKDIDEIPESGDLITPLAFPDPGGWLSNVSLPPDTFGTLGTEQVTLTYSLNYIFLFAPAGGGIAAFDNYNAMITKLGQLVTIVANNDTMTGANDVRLESVSDPAYIEAPDGTLYQGFRFSLRVAVYL